MLQTNVDALASNDLHPQTDGGRRSAAARLLEGHLVQLGRAGLLIDRHLAPGLLRLRSRRLYRPLGYVRLADYVGERLGMSLRRCQAILRLERMLAGLPRLLRALLDGELSLSRVETVAAAATSATEDLWLERARRLTVPALREAVARAAQAGGRDAGAQDGGIQDGDVRDAGGDAAPASSPAEVAPSPVTSIEEDEPGRLVTFSAPARVLAVWHWALDLIRRVAGRQEPAWRCAEYLAAEFLSGVPDLSPEPEPSAKAALSAEPGLSAEPEPSAHPNLSADAGPVAGSASKSDAGARPHPTPRFVPESDAAAVDWAGLAAWSAASAAVREALASIGSAADPERILSEGPRAAAIKDEGACGDDVEADAWTLDARLRRLVRLRQSLAWRQGRLLATLASLRLHAELGFATLDDFVTERLAMSPRRARYLVSLDRRLRDLPLLADAYRRGLVSWCQARLLVRVIAPSTQSRWIRYAREVTVRRLEDVVVACEVAAAESPAHVGASPLPPTEATPGRAVAGPMTASAGPDSTRLHTSAPPTVDTRGLHTSAPLEAAATGPFVPTAGSASAVLDSSLALPHGHSDRRIAFWAPLEVAALWDSALRACRAAAGRHLDDWECFLLFVQALRDTWENPDDPHWKRRYRIFERDGWRCMAPGCTSRSGLNEHHVVFRSQRGGDDEGNLVTLCIGHHQQGVHEGRIACFGRAPDALWWDLGLRRGGPPLARYFGERVVRRRPFAHAPSDVAPDVGAATPAPMGRVATPAPMGRAG